MCRSSPVRTGREPTNSSRRTWHTRTFVPTHRDGARWGPSPRLDAYKRAVRILSAMAPYRALVVDDHPDTAEVISVLLQMLGHQPRCALRGREALRIAKELDPDLILLDISMPDLSGYEVIRALRADPRGQDRFIVAVSGHGRPSDLSRAATAGFDGYIVKPIDIGKIRHVLLCADAHYAQGQAQSRTG